jgi:hypothetical protein
MDNISFPVPKGFTPPEGVAEGDSFDFMASGYFKGPIMYLTAVEGVAVSPGKEVEVETETEMPEEDMSMVQAVEKGMSSNEMA